ncbi:hypothetical protein LF1_05930 [Rubripirellula obstinata]|uniref:GmrSD restriction endonucleases N-terminal domain-containing protein n=3 Tax=Rubripirellula obstinata TaxID=406547 RepID=A0A5B1CAB8_9BACT|nr:hypothetical protein LF1_05930 [Rubripirellula obstinata]
MTVKTKNEDDVEGLDENVDSGLGDYPIDTMMIRKETRTIFDVVRRIQNGGFVLDPDFQREFVWNAERQSRLIESVIMRIPLPVFYLAEDLEGRTIVVDGLQRLTTFQRFFDNSFALELGHQASLNGKTFQELPPKLQNRVEDCNLELYIIDAQVPERAKLDIFERVNSGEPLTRQQMRNCIYTGPASRWLRDEVEKPLFIEATGKSLRQKTMRDREFANRFCAFYLLGPDEYRKSDMDDFLARSLTKMNKMSESELEALSEAFRTGLQNNLNLFGNHAFRKHIPDQDRRSVVNASLWDVMSTGLARFSEADVSKREAIFKNAFYALLENHEFIDSITYSVNSTNKVQRRFELAGEMFSEVFDVA